MGYFASVSKSFKLHSLSKKLSAPSSLDPKDWFSGASDPKKAALEELFDLCVLDPTVSSVMQQHGIGRNDLKEIYLTLKSAGASQWVGAHYVPASTLAFGATLDYAVRKLLRSEDPKATTVPATMRLVTYFERGEVGLIAD